jgi:hypothetical protein
VTLKPALAIEGKLSLPKIDLDRTLAALSAVAPAAAVPGKPAPPAAPTTGTSVLDTVSAKLAIEAAEVVYSNQPVRTWSSSSTPRAACCRAEAFGDPAGRHGAAGAVDPVGRSGATQRQRRLQPGRAQAARHAQLAGDRCLIGAGQQAAAAQPQGPTGLERRQRAGERRGVRARRRQGRRRRDGDLQPAPVGGDAARHRHDRYRFVPGQGSGWPEEGPGSGATRGGRASRAGRADGRAEAQGAKAIYNRETIGGIDVDLALQGHALKLNDVKVANLGGARLAVRGAIANYHSALPNADIAFNFEAPDLGRVLKVAGATAPANLGQVTASGAVNGTVEALTFREVNIGAQGQAARIDGTLTMPGAAKGPPSSIGYKGRVMANGQTIEGTVDAKVAERPSITADLKTTLLDLDKLGGATPAQPAQRGARPAAAPAAASSSTDLAGLRAFDASLKLVAGHAGQLSHCASPMPTSPSRSGTAC